MAVLACAGVGLRWGDGNVFGGEFDDPPQECNITQVVWC